MVTNAKTRNSAFFCVDCFNSVEVHADYSSVKKILPVDPTEIPKDAVPVLNPGFDIKNSSGRGGDLSVFEAADDRTDGAKIIDKTLQCHNPRFMIQSDAKEASQLGDDGALRVPVEDQRIEIDPKAKLTREQKIAVKRLEGAIINKERNISERELDNLLDSYKNAEPAIEGSSEAGRLE